MAYKKKFKLSSGAKKAIALASLALISYIYVTYIQPKLGIPHKIDANGFMQVHFIDVDQGDSALIVTPNGKNIIIDAGPNSAEQSLIAYLAGQRIKEFEHAFFTHPHEDHIGNADVILERYKVNAVTLSHGQTSSSSFERMLERIDRSSTDADLALPGRAYEIDGVKFTVLGPLSDEYEELNNYSIVLRVEFGDSAFIFTGDAEAVCEREMLEYWSDDADLLDCDVLKLGHHGSSTSTTEEFLGALSPEYAIASCAKANEYGHPHREIVSRLRESGVKLLRTYEEGSIVFLSDGKTVSLADKY